MKKWLVVLLGLFIMNTGIAQKVFDFTPRCQQAYHDIMKLRLQPGRQLIQQERQQNPNNLIPELLEGYIDFFELFFNEDPSHYANRKAAFDERIAAFEEGNRNSPFYRYCLGLAYMQRAAVRIKFGERFGAGWDFKKANSYIKDNRSKFPSFQPNNMVFGPITVIIGTVPSGYKWITGLLGMRGSVSQGMQIMRNFINSNDPYAKLLENEAIFYYCYLMNYVENKPEEVFKFIESNKLDIQNNHLFTYMAANLAINNKRTDYAVSILQNRNKSEEYMHTPVWNMEMGYVRMHQLKLDEALKHLDSFIANFKGNFYVKDVLMKMSWAYYLKGDHANAEKYRQLCIRKGNVDTDADKKAYRDAKGGKWPDATLLKARLLNDGGYNKEALTMLASKNVEEFADQGEQLEYAYRAARIYDDLGKDDEALKYYRQAINLGKGRTEYYAARAALQMGHIYEKRGQKKLAIAAYQQCLDMKNHEYKDSLDQRAKSGLARCKGD